MERPSGSLLTVAAALMLVSPMASAAGNGLVKRWGSHVHPLSITAVPMAICATIVGSLALALERGDSIDWSVRTVLALLYLAVAGSAFTFTVYFWLLQRISATRLSLMVYVIPVVALVVGALGPNEPVGSEMIGGTLLVLRGGGLAGRSGTRRKAPGRHDSS